MYSNVYHIQNIELGSAQRVCGVHWGHIENAGVVLSSWSSVCEVNDGSKSYCLLEMLIFFPGIKFRALHILGQYSITELHPTSKIFRLDSLSWIQTEL